MLCQLASGVRGGAPTQRIESGSMRCFGSANRAIERQVIVLHVRIIHRRSTRREAGAAPKKAHVQHQRNCAVTDIWP